MNRGLQFIRYLRKLLSDIWSKQFLVFLFFVGLSLAFWLFQNLSGYYESEFEIPVRLVNVPERVVVTTEPQSTLRVTLKDHGSTLLQYRYLSPLKPVVIDFSQYDTRSGHVVIFTRELIKQITQQLFSTTRITAYRPDTLEYYYSFGSHKRIPVRFNGHIGASGQLRVSALSLRPDSVSVYALPSVLDTITAAYTLPVKTVQVPVEMVNFPATKVLRTFPTKVSITFQIGTSNYNSITADNFVIVVSYDELMNNYSGKFTPRLKTVPAGVSHVRINPREVEFIIEDIPSDN